VPKWKLVECRAVKCRKPITFLKTAAGRQIPVDVDIKLNEHDELYEHGRHTPHHSTCLDVGTFRKRKIGFLRRDKRP
jgi:hypothetical protein